MLFKLHSSQDSTFSKVKRVTFSKIGWKEKDFERLLSNNIGEFISSNNLMTIFCERSRQEEPDIMALDAEGDLYIFELKRWEGKQENLLQVLRYGQMFGKSKYDDLAELYRKYQHNSDADLYGDFQAYFDKAIPKEKYNQKQHFVIVTNGLDQATVESILYWKDCGLQIDAIIYWIFEINGEYYLEMSPYSQIEGFLDYETNFYLLNTNNRYGSEYTDQMLTAHKAAAYAPGWREKIQRFQKGDLVFLYKSGTGIVAYGYADGVLNKCTCDGIADYEYNMHLKPFVDIHAFPISPSEMKVIANYGFTFLQTLVSMPEDAAKALKAEADKRAKLVKTNRSK